ncbi:MAG: hypothetical protein V4642_16545 [Bacteroidota bacterium]
MEQFPNRYTKNHRVLLVALLLGILSSGSLFAGTITVTGTLSSFLTSRKVASTSQSYTVSGTDLGTNNIVITAPTVTVNSATVATYEISTSSGSGYGTTLNLTPSSGTVNSTTIYVRMTGVYRGNFSGNITHVSSGSTTQTLAVTGKVNRLPAETYYQGTVLPGIDHDQGNGNGDVDEPIGFTFRYRGADYTLANVSAHGYLVFANTNVNTRANDDIYTNSSPNDYLAPFWDAMYMSIANCNNVIRTTIGSAPNRKFIVQWNNARFENTISPHGTFQCILYETSNIVQFQYRQLLQNDKSFGQSATIGLEWDNPTNSGIQYSFNTASIYEGLAIRFTPDGSGNFSSFDTTVAYDPIILGNTSTPTPSIPDAEAPGPTSTGTSQITKFWWKTSTDVSGGYNLKVATTIGFTAGTVVIDTIVSDTSARLQITKRLAANTTYYWATVALGSGCEKTWSQVNSFTTASTAPKYATFSPASPLSFGSLAVGSTSSPTTVTITGANLTSAMTATVTGDFTINGGTSTVSIPASGGTLQVRFAPTASGSRTGRITLTGGGLDYDEIYILTGTGTSATPTITTTGALNAFSTPQGTPSAQQSYSVAATGLTANLTITPPTGYEVSTTSGSSFASSLTLTPSSGVVSSTTIYVRLTGATAGTSSGNITNASTGATTQNVAATGTVGLITVSGPLNAFSTSQGSTSSEQSYTVSGSGLTGNITVNAPTGYEIATTSGGTFGTSLTLTQTSGSVSSTTIFVRMTGATAGIISGDITHAASGGATTQNKAVTGTVGMVTISAASLSAFSTSQGSTSSQQSYTVSGSGLTGDITVTAPTGYEISTTTGGTFTSSVALTPTSGSVSSTTIFVRMTGATAGTPSGNITNASTGATTKNVAVTGSVSLITVGGALNAFSTAQGTVSAEQSYTVSGSGLTGNITITPPTGYEISTTTGGTFGTSLTLTPSSGTVNSTTIFVRMTGATAGTPGGNISHVSSGAATQNKAVSGSVSLITVSGALNAFSTAHGTVSTEQSYTVLGSGLTGNITVTPPTGYELSITSGGTFSSSLTLTQTSGNVTSTTIFVRMTGATAGTPSGNITHASSGATTQNNAVTGTVRAVTVSGALNAFSTPQGTASASQNYTVSGSNLSGNITITAPAGFEIRTGANAYSGTVILTPTSGSVSSTIDVRLTGATGGTFSGTITHVSTGASSPTVAASGTVSAISTSSSALTGFSTAQGTPSVSQNYTVSGIQLTANITITAPTGFEIRTGTNAYSGSVTLIPVSGTVSTTTIDVRLTGASAGSFSDNITHTSTGASSPNVAVIGTVSLITTSGALNAFSTPQGTASTSQPYTVSGAGLTGDITITAPDGYEIRTGSNAYGGTVTLSPTSGSVLSTTIDVRLTGAIAGLPSGNISHASAGATTQTKAVSGAVGLITVSGTALNAFSTNQGAASSSQNYTVSASGLAGDLTIAAPTGYEVRTGSNAYSGTITLIPTSGVVSSTTIDIRLTGTSGGTFNGNITHSSSSATTQNKAVSGTVTGPTVSITGGTLNAFSTPQGTASTAQSYTVSGAGLTNDITITAPTGFEIRTGSNAYSGSITLTRTGSTVSATTIDVRLTGTSAGLFNTNIANASSGATTQNVAVTGSVSLISTSASLSAFATAQGSASSSQSYTVSGSGLTGDIIITAPTGYEIRTGSNAYAGTVTLSPTSGSVSSTTIDVRLTGASAGLPSGNITNVSTGATTQNVAASGSVGLITVTGSLNAFSTTQGTASSSESYTVSGSGLTGNLTITAPTGYEIRTGSNSYSGTVTLSPTSGSVSSTTIDVRLTGASAGTITGNITHTASGGATTQNKAVIGSVTGSAAISITGTLNAFSTSLGTPSASQSYTISGSNLTNDITVTAPTGYEVRTGSNAYASSLTLTQSGGTVSSTTIDVRMTGASAGIISGDIANTSTGATTQNVTATGSVRSITVTGTLNSFSTPQGTASASQSYTVSASGLTGNITITAPTGYEIRTGSNAYAVTVTLTPTSGSVSSTTIDVRLTGATGGTFSGNITHASTGAATQNIAATGNTAVITITGALSAFSTPTGTPSGAQNYTVSATGLTGNLTVTAPTGYEIRTGSNSYGGTVTLTPSSGNVPSTTIDARLTGASAGTFTDNITHSSTGASTQNVAVTGTVSTGIVLPTVTTTSYITAITLTAGTAAGNVTADGGASVTARGVCWNTTGTPTTADSKTTDGTGTGSFTSSMTGLTNTTVYHVRAYATNSAGTAYGAVVKVTAGRVYVKSSATGAIEGSTWTDAYTDLATAISRIDAGEVWVTAGTYKPTATTDRTLSFTAKNNVALLGGFAGNESAASARNATSNVTTLSGEIGAAGTSDNSYHIVSGTGLDATAIVDGFTITAGNCDGSSVSNYDRGAGLYLVGSPFLKRLNITGNTGTQAIGLYNLGAPTISYVTYGSGNTWIVKR